MKRDRWRPRGRKISIAFVIGSVLCGCASGHSRDSASTSPTERDQVEIACEIALLQLGRLIEERTAEDDFAPAILLEAKELYRLGKELYLEREYELALELIEEAIQLLEEDRD